MRVCGIGLIPIKPNFINSYKQQAADKPVLNVLQHDTVSFSAKPYGPDSISNPTNHCAYCGTKVYTDKELKALSRQILKLSSNELQGKLNSVIDKLGKKNDGSNLSKAKLENNLPNVEFFEDLRDLSLEIGNHEKTASVLLASTYGDQADLVSLVRDNLQPLLKSVDHVCPQNQKLPNINVEENLVESCQACNHDLKNGLLFDDFYKKYPEIQKYMPNEKFKFALANGVNGSSALGKSLSADEVKNKSNKLIERLVEYTGRVDSTKRQMHLSILSIDEMINDNLDEIKISEAQITELEEKLSALEKDQDFKILLAKKKILSSIEADKSEISRINHIIGSKNKSIANKQRKIDAVNNPTSSKKSKRRSSNTQSINVEQLQGSIKATQADIDKLVIDKNKLNKSIESKERELAALKEIQLNISDLEFEVSALRQNLKDYDGIADANDSLAKIDEDRKELRRRRDLATTNIDKKNNLLQTTYNDVELDQAVVDEYDDLVSQLNEIKENKSKRSTKGKIYSAARTQIILEAKEYAKNPSVKISNMKKVITKLEQIINDLDKNIDKLDKKYDSTSTYKQELEGKPKAGTKSEVEEVLEARLELLGNLKSKADGLNLWNRILKLKVEINLLEKSNATLKETRSKLEDKANL